MNTPISLNAEDLPALCLATQGGDGVTMDPPMNLALQASYGSLEGWRAAFVAMVKAQEGDSGWGLLSFQPHEGRLINHWCAAHSPDLTGAMPILALDKLGHAEHPDASVDAFVRRIDWAGVYERYQAAVHTSSESLAAQAQDLADAMVLDVRRSAVYEAAPTMLPDARWLDPAAVAAWAPSLPGDREIIVYCVYGHEVGRATAMRLRAAGLKARYLQGGIDAWSAAGRPVVAKPTAAKVSQP